MRYTIKNLIEAYESGALTPNEILKYYLNKIENNKSVNSFIKVLEQRATKQVFNLSVHGLDNDYSLFGIPISYKDSIDISGEITTNGSDVPNKKHVSNNAKVVDILEAAGCISVGKNNMHEFSTGITSENSYYGDVINPVNPEYTVGGSSSGSAAAVAAGLVIGAIGTDTSGSVRIPAACCGVPSIKLTYNPELLNGVTPISYTLDHLGVIAGSIEDLRKISSPLSNDMDRKINHKNASQIKIGIDMKYFSNNIDREIDEMMKLAVKKFKSLGVEIVEIDLSYLENIVSFSRIIGTTEASFHHQSLFNEFNKKYENQLFETVRTGRNISAHSYLEAMCKKSYYTKKVNQEFEEIDLILAPLMPLTIPTLKRIRNWKHYESLGDCMVKYTQPFNITGNPAISLPSGYQKDSINQSIQLISRYNEEMVLFNVAKFYDENI